MLARYLPQRLNRYIEATLNELSVDLVAKMLRSLYFFCFLFCSLGAIAATESTPVSPQVAETADQLKSLQVLIDANGEARSKLRLQIKNSDPNQTAERELELESLNKEISKLRSSFEQAAIGSVDLNVLSEIETNFNWREEITLILQPIFDNLKALTDKPRKISHLKSQLELKQRQKDTIINALDSIGKVEGLVGGETQKSVENLERSWEILRDTNLQDLNLINSQIARLQNSDVTWWETLRVSLEEFFRGRGLTLLFAASAASIVWLFMRALLWLFQHRGKQKDSAAFRTRSRLVQYSYRALVALLVLMAVIAVFYIRGDLLLLGLSIIAAAALALGLRKTVPRFISEGQLLLNLGSIREQERVIFNGLPWLVTSINMFSILRNPELSGVLRLPLRELSGLISRPDGHESWFPTSRGDVILTSDRQLLEVVRQTPETVELLDAGGSVLTVKTDDFYGWTFKNLTRGDAFGVAVIFGVGYELQNIALSNIPFTLKAGISESLAKTDFAQSVLGVMVELSAAGSSSLDYLIYVTLKSDAGKSYKKVERLVQQACVSVCTQENWGIPYPHLNIVQAVEPKVDLLLPSGAS